MSDLIEVKGYGGSVSFDGQFVTIRRGGLGRLVVGQGDKRIPVRSISAIQLKPAGPIVNGLIEFSMSGGDERRSRVGGQTADAAGDENSVIFTATPAAGVRAAARGGRAGYRDRLDLVAAGFRAGAGFG